MKVLQTISNLSRHSGGISTCTYDLLSAMQELDIHVDLLALQKQEPVGKNKNWLKMLPNDAVGPYAYSRNMHRFLKQSDYDLYHTNGLWLYCNHITCEMARRKQKPYVITPHGMLYPEALARSYWKKWPLLKIFFEKDILQSDCIHVTCQQELKYVRAFGYRGPVAIIANPANLPPYLSEIALAKPIWMKNEQPRKIGFLGRLHPIKKVENLLYGMSLLKRPTDVQLIILGKGEEAYENFLRKEARRLGLTNIKFHGFVNGREKYEQLARLSCLFVPSDFENFGMIVTEALSVCTPVMASLGTPWEELNTKNCGWWVDRTPENIAMVIREVISMSSENLLAMGKRVRTLIEEKYSAKQASTQMENLYQWLTEKKSCPDFIQYI